jgi:hypothetical protein
MAVQFPDYIPLATMLLLPEARAALGLGSNPAQVLA